MNSSLLPIGSVISALDNEFMVVGYLKKKEISDEKQYDYICCLYPYGVGEDSYIINKEQIKKVLFIGFQDGMFSKLKKDLL